MVTNPDGSEAGYEFSMDCPICLESMMDADHEHPMQCTSVHCTYNFCMNCIESMVVASKDDFEESSDGNRHVKVYLHCPNCRSDLSETIRDTLLLRKADFLLSNKGLPDSELTDSQKRLKTVINNEEVKKAISMARNFEKEFFESHDIIEQISTVSEDSETSSYNDDDECGVEIDLHGVHKSFRLPKSEKEMIDEIELRRNMVDKTLLRGLDRVMSKDEQRNVTQLMTSGDTVQLVEAAKILKYMEQNMRVPLKVRLQKRSSIYNLIDEIEKVHSPKSGIFKLQKLPSNVGSSSGHRMVRRSTFSRRASSMLSIGNSEFLQMHPLPIRMPKYVEFDFADLVGGCQFSLPFGESDFPVTFVDDSWDGTVRDAYARITIMPLTGSITRHTPPLNHKGVLNVLGEGLIDKDLGIARIAVEKPRVIVKSIKGDAGRSGVIQGDVVTHLDGEEFNGTAHELVEEIRRLISQKSGTDDQCLTLVLNAEAPIAEALKRRGNLASCYLYS